MAKVPNRHVLHDAIMEFYDNRASIYDTEKDKSNAFHLRLADDMVKWAVPYIPESLRSPAKVLDLCCGTGMVSMEVLRQLGPNTVLHGVDISAASLKIAREKAVKQGGSKAEFFESSVTELESLPLEKSSYSMITCCSALVLLPSDDLPGILRMWATYLKPGGVLIFDVPSAKTQLVSTTMTAVIAEYKVPTLAFDWIKSESSVSQLIQDAGLLESSTFVTEELTERMHKVDHLGEVWEQSTKIPMVNIRALTDEQQQEAKRSFVKKMTDLAGDDGIIRDGYRVYIGIATKPTSF